MFWCNLKPLKERRPWWLQLCPRPGCRWQPCPSCLSLLSVSACPPLPVLAGTTLSPSPALGSCAWPVPPPSVPVGAVVLPGPRLRGRPCVFLSCFTFHFRIPCRADPSPERPSPSRAYRSVARISYTSQATWGDREGLRDLPGAGKVSGPLSSCPPALQLWGRGRPCLGTGQSA